MEDQDDFAPSPEQMPPSFPPEGTPEHVSSSGNGEASQSRDRQEASAPADAPEATGSWLRSVGEFFLVIVAALVISVLIKTFFVQAFWVPSGSMESTLMPGDRIAVSRMNRGVEDIHRGDVVVFSDPGAWLESTEESDSWFTHTVSEALQAVGLLPQNTGEHLVKRVIGIGGDTVACAGNGAPITVNGVAIDETYLDADVVPSETAFSVTVPEGKLWVMGDNRADSKDSRYHEAVEGNGFVPVENVAGKAFAIFYPLSRFGGLPDGASAFADVP